MRKLAILNGGGRVLANRAWLADGWWTRLRGLLGRPRLGPGEGLMLEPCKAIHTFGMSYPIDVAFLDPEGRVVATYDEIAPWRHTRWHGGAIRALELPPGTLNVTGTGVGDTVTLRPVGAAAPHATAIDRNGG